MGKIQIEQLKTDYFAACSSTAPNSNQERLSQRHPSCQSHRQASMSDSSSVKALPKITIMEHTAGEVLPADFDK
jgi:hypothetical protein